MLNFAALKLLNDMFDKNNEIKRIGLQIHPLVNVIEQIFNLYSDLFEDIIGIYKGVSVIESYSCKNKEALPETERFISWASQQRAVKTTASVWKNPEELPFFKYEPPPLKNVTRKKDPGFFGEFKKTALVIYYNGYYEKDKNELIVVYPKFEENSLFTDVESLSQHNKKVFESLMEAAIKVMLSREYEIHSFMKEVAIELNMVRKTWERKKEEQLQTKGKQLYNAQSVLGKLNNQCGMPILLSEEAEQIILNFEGDAKVLENELTRVVNLAINNPFYESKASIRLDSLSLIRLENMNIEERKSNPSRKYVSYGTIKENKSGRNDKTEALLNRLEEAVKLLMENREKITGKNIAAKMKISPPAVSDSIYNHRERIFNLMSNEQSRWNLLYEFKPIRTIISTGKNRE